MSTAVATRKQNIFQITQEALELNELLLESGGELTPELEAALAINQESFELKAGNYALVVKQNDAEIKIIEEEIKRLQGLKKNRENANTRLKEVVKGCMNLLGIEKIKLEGRSLYFMNTKSVEVTDDAIVPNEFKEWKAEVKKSLIKEALEAGETVPGAELKPNQSLVIR